MVLIAEDDAVIRDLLRQYLQRAGYDVLTAADGNEAVELSRAHPSIDFLLTDLEMPSLDGVSAYRRIHREFPEIQVLFMSGNFDGGIQAPAKLPRIRKPFRLEELGRKIADILHTNESKARRKVILVVDNNARRQERTKTILAENGYAVRTARSVEEAITATDGEGAIDLIVSDVLFDGQNGIQLAEHIEASDRPVSTLLISHSSSRVLHAMPGFSRQPEFLPNPFTAEILLRRVRRLLNE